MRNKIAKAIFALLTAAVVLAGAYVIFYKDSAVVINNEVPYNEQEELVVNPITRKERTEEAVVLDTLDRNQELLGIINPPVISYINENTDSKYVYVSVSNEGTTLFPEGEKEFQEEIDSVKDEILGKLGPTYSKESIAQIELDAIAVVKALSANQTVDENIHFGLQNNGGFKSSAFAGQNIAKHAKIKDFSNVKEEDIKKHFEEKGLKLTVNDISVSKVISNELSASLLEVTTVVECTVKCDNNDGEYSSLEWIPSVGSTEKISFVIQFQARCYSGSIHEVIIRDIAIL